MEQNEEPTEKVSAEPIENCDAETVFEENAATVAESSTDEKKESPDENEKLPVITNPKATIKFEGQEFELEAALAQKDKTLKAVLQPNFASVENANITRDVKEGKLTVTIVKRAQHKGA